MTLTKLDYATLTFAMENYIADLEQEGSSVPPRFYEILWELSDLYDKVSL